MKVGGCALIHAASLPRCDYPNWKRKIPSEVQTVQDRDALLTWELANNAAFSSHVLSSWATGCTLNKVLDFIFPGEECYHSLDPRGEEGGRGQTEQVARTGAGGQRQEAG